MSTINKGISPPSITFAEDVTPEQAQQVIRELGGEPVAGADGKIAIAPGSELYNRARAVAGSDHKIDAYELQRTAAVAGGLGLRGPEGVRPDQPTETAVAIFNGQECPWPVKLPSGVPDAVVAGAGFLFSDPSWFTNDTRYDRAALADVSTRIQESPPKPADGPNSLTIFHPGLFQEPPLDLASIGAILETSDKLILNYANQTQVENNTLHPVESVYLPDGTHFPLPEALKGRVLAHGSPEQFAVSVDQQRMQALTTIDDVLHDPAAQALLGQPNAAGVESMVAGANLIGHSQGGAMISDLRVTLEELGFDTSGQTYMTIGAAAGGADVLGDAANAASLTMLGWGEKFGMESGDLGLILGSLSTQARQSHNQKNVDVSLASVMPSRLSGGEKPRSSYFGVLEVASANFADVVATGDGLKQMGQAFTGKGTISDFFKGGWKTISNAVDVLIPNEFLSSVFLTTENDGMVTPASTGFNTKPDGAQLVVDGDHSSQVSAESFRALFGARAPNNKS